METLIIKKNIQKWIDKKITNIKPNSRILLLGATGAMGGYLSIYLSYLKCDLVLAGRNVEELNKLKTQCEPYGNNVDILKVDFADVKTIDSLIEYTKNNKLDCIVNNIGIYHLPVKYIDGIEQTFMVNYLSPIYYFENVKEYIKVQNIKVVNVGSISYKFKNINYKDIEATKTKNKTLRYSQSKSLLMNLGLNLKKEGVDSILVHPGISTTNLFLRKHKAYPEIFYVFVVPIMKVLFMPPKKAALTLLKGIDSNNLPLNKWIGPRGLFHCWGYPNAQKLHTKKLDKFNKEILEETNKKLSLIKK